MRPLTIVDGVTVEVKPEPSLIPVLEKSIELGYVAPDETVLWEGKECKWSELAGNERMEVERGEDGILRGSFPF